MSISHSEEEVERGEPEQQSDAVAEAVLAEREACAKLAAATTAYDDGLQKAAGCGTTGERIAAAIRSRAVPGQEREEVT